MRLLRRYLFLALGFAALGLALAGVALPLLPTTPFALLAAFFFARSSPRRYEWLVSMPKIGPAIKNWDQHRVIDPKSKIIAIALIFASAAYIVFISGRTLPVKAGVVAVLTAVSVFLITRPGSPKAAERASDRGK
ncbi:MAG: YbaN family protein [Thermoleophilia bacterium]|nr:YbaN family protein [Thermoleophilia bacterium]